jgi:Protein of unknown function (DUF3551)
MKKLMIAGVALSALLTGSGQLHALNYPWCAIGEGRGVDCVFASKMQCAQDGRGRGFGGQCYQNPYYNPVLVAGFN